MPHVVLLGDSIFDNLKYVQPEPDVVSQLREVLPAGWKASLRAVDERSRTMWRSSSRICQATLHTWSSASAETIYLAVLETCCEHLWL